ncbi:hypothetical protein JOM56_007612 [Amanita muscaria]
MRNQISTVAGIWIIISVFDSTDAPKTAGVDLIATENSVAAWVEDYQVDDDIDYEVASGLFSVCFRVLARWILEAEELSCEHGCLRDYTDLLILVSSTRRSGNRLTTMGRRLEVHSIVGDSINWYNVLQLPVIAFFCPTTAICPVTDRCRNLSLVNRISSLNMKGVHTLFESYYIRPGRYASSALLPRYYCTQYLVQFTNSIAQWIRQVRSQGKSTPVMWEDTEGIVRNNSFRYPFLFSTIQI